MKLTTLDLHETRHGDVEEQVCRFLNWSEIPCRIITGKSPRMRSIVEQVIDRYGYTCYSESTINYGSLIVIEPMIKDFE